MSAAATSHDGGMAAATRLAMPGGGGHEGYEQLLELADTIGAAYVAAYQQIGAGYVEAAQKDGPGIGSLQSMLSDQGRPNWQSAFNPSGPANDRLADAADRSLIVGDNLTDMSAKIGLACLDACEQATLAVAACQEQIGAASGSDVLKCTTAASAELARKVTRATAEAFRNIAG